MTKKTQIPIPDTLQKRWAELSTVLGHIEQEATSKIRWAMEHLDPAQATEEIQRTLADLGKRMQDSGEQLEQRVHDHVRTLVSRVKEPLMEELASLRHRVEALSTRIESQVSSQQEAAPPEAPGEADDTEPPR